MSSNSHHFWQLTTNNNHGYYQAPPNYYVSRNMADPHWYDNIEDPYLRDFYNTTTNYYNTGYYYYCQPTSGYIIDNQFPFMVSTNSQSGHTYIGQSSFDYIDEPYLWDDVYNQPTGEFIDGVYVMNESEFIDHHRAQINNHYVSRNIGDHYFAPHNLDHNSGFTGPDHTYTGQSLFDHIDYPNLWDDVYNQPTGEFINGVYVTTEFIDDEYDTTESGFTDDDSDTTESGSDDDVDDIAYLRGLLENLVLTLEGDKDEEEVTEEIIANMMKTRTHCGTNDGGEICIICQCEYENDETIGTLECQHEYHSGCIKEWLLKGKMSCPICRSSVLPS